jgi:CHAT domain
LTGNQGPITSTFLSCPLNLQGTELVILSACDSGTGEVKIGERVMALRRAFRIAGAQTVLASHWKVSDQAPRLLHGLQRPYQYRPGAIYLDRAAACWRLVPVEEQPSPPDVFFCWLEELKENRDVETLRELAGAVAEATAHLP